MVIVMVAFLSLFSFSLLTVSADYVGHSVVGEVEQGNYTYYTLRQPGHLQLSLTSDQGDADLYVSAAEIERPTFNFEDHDLSSATCGEDTVHITPDFTRNCSYQPCFFPVLSIIFSMAKISNSIPDQYISESTVIPTTSRVHLSWRF